MYLVWLSLQNQELTSHGRFAGSVVMQHEPLRSQAGTCTRLCTSCIGLSTSS